MRPRLSAHGGLSAVAPLFRPLSEQRQRRISQSLTRFLQIALDRWDCLAYESVVVGDSLLEDIRGGIELGAQTVLVRSATDAQVRHDNELHAAQVVPDAVLDDLQALPAIIRAWT
ncbi:MAG: HAD hydrolase-like protein [Anaerolineales bacterium]|nr:HAD hydrolase-like protein [Anaerolineales bacterium]